jgi:hypothetical protein
MTRHKPDKRARLLRSLYMWHRWLGLAAAVFVMVLSITGLLLNHTEELELDSRHVRASGLLDWYGIRVPAGMQSYPLGKNIVTQVGDRLYWNTTQIPLPATRLIGAVDFSDFAVVAIEGELLLLSDSGELIERLDGAAGVPAGMQAIGISAGGTLAIRAAHGYYQTDHMFLEWTETDTLQAAWAGASTPEPELRAALEQAWRGSGLSLERVLLDLHSGRILGSKGVYLMDAAAVLFLVLAASGVWLWSRRRASIREHRENRATHGR